MTRRPLPPRARLALLGATVLLAVASAAVGARRTLSHIDTGAHHYGKLIPGERLYAAAENTGIPFGLFDLLALQVHPGDRMWLQIPHQPYGTLDLHDTIGALARFYLLPAVEVASIDRATVVVSYIANPADLHRGFIDQVEIGNGMVVSRLAPPGART